MAYTYITSRQNAFAFFCKRFKNTLTQKHVVAVELILVTPRFVIYNYIFCFFGKILKREVLYILYYFITAFSDQY